ncbi:pantoate--beta-alanine ligase [Nitriliruptor alkaliphilus]|uniref:pantoate--beta-alanine ligase n=1 Tax=Nitriliruptor alkaliphilus TaxID=427918 RepID=UPI000697618A|nr:pantoate--beta-alanine ligase [Nitriliruptor alkaliphilus]
MRRVTTIAEVRAAVAAARADGQRVGLVPTMGALHEGHLALVREAAIHADVVVVSVFVNPTQFDRADDLAAYPRDLDGDEAQLAALGDLAPAIVFAPDTGEVYPREPLTTVTVAGLTERLCGASRPGHFDGVATVCTKLFSIVQPDLAVFGRKDFQQLQVIRRVVADLDLPVEVIGAPTIREPDGLAMSSRNRRLSTDDRASALALSRALRAGVAVRRRAAAGGHPIDPVRVREEVAGTLGAAPGVTVDYVEVLDPETLTPPDASSRGQAGDGPPEADQLLVAVAAHVGPVRLIDNVVLGDTEDEERLLAATS